MEIKHCSKKYSDAELRLIKQVKQQAMKMASKVSCFAISDKEIMSYDLDGGKLDSRYTYYYLGYKIVSSLLKNGLDNFDFCAMSTGLVYE